MNDVTISYKASKPLQVRWKDGKTYNITLPKEVEALKRFVLDYTGILPYRHNLRNKT